MAISIISSPKFDSSENEVFVRPLHQRWIYLASSDNTGEDGFRYKLTLTAATAGISETFLIPPDPDGIMIFDAYETLRNLHRFGDNPENIHFVTDEFEETLIGQVDVSIIETYYVDGEYTEFPLTEQTIEGPFCFWGAYDGATGPYPPSTTFAMTATSGISSRALSDRKPNTHVWEMAATYGLNPSECIFIPSRELDWGVLTAITDLVTTTNRLVYKIVDASGTTHTENIDIAGHVLTHIPVYPANINAGALGIVNKPSDYSGWKYYTVQFVDASELRAPVSVKYVFFPEQGNCDYDNIRIGWRTHRGGWDYFNFNMRNFFERNITRNRFERGYSKASFTGQSRKAFERYPTVDRLLNISSRYVVEREREFLQWMFQSTEVRIIRDNGTSIPVLVETNSVTPIVRAEPNPLEQVNVQLKYAGDELNWNGWWVDKSEVDEVNTFDLGGFRLVYEPGSTNAIVSINLQGPTSVDVDWGDGTTETISTPPSMSHTYTAPFGVTRVVRITNPNAPITSVLSQETTLLEVYAIPSSVTGGIRFEDSFLSQENCDYLFIKANENGGVEGVLVLPLDASSSAAISAKASLIAKDWNINIG